MGQHTEGWGANEPITLSMVFGLRPRQLIFPTAAAVLGLAVTWLVVSMDQRHDDGVAAQDFAQTSEVVMGDARFRIESHLSALEDARTASGLAWPLTAERFDDWYVRTEFDRRFPAIARDVQLWEWVDPGEVAEVEERERQSGRPEFALPATSDGGQLTRVHRRAGADEKSLGDNMLNGLNLVMEGADWSEPGMGKPKMFPLGAAEVLFDLDSTAIGQSASGPMLILLPLNQPDGTFVGWLAAVLDPALLVDSAEVLAPLIDLGVEYNGPAGVVPLTAGAPGGFTSEKAFEFWDLEWNLDATSTDGRASGSTQAWVIGLLVTFAVVLAIVYREQVLSRERANASRLVEEAAKARTCSLTKLGNRLSVDERLEALDASSTSAQRVCVFFLDLNGFKEVNDSAGHDVGDDVLVEVARRLEESAGVLGQVSRLGGDEFLVIVDHIHSSDDITRIRRAVNEPFERPFNAGGATWTIGASIGVAVQGNHASRPRDLLRAADELMYRQKLRSRQRVVPKNKGAARLPV